MTLIDQEISNLVRRIEALQDMADRHPAARTSILATANGLASRLEKLRARVRKEARR